MRARLAVVTALAGLLVPLAPAHAATTYELVSVARTPGTRASYYPATAISGNGRYVAFLTSYNELSAPPFEPPVPCCVPGQSPTVQELWLADLVTKKHVKVMTGYCCINAITLSHDGRYLVFDSYEKTVVPGDKNEMPDVMVYDRTTRRMTRMLDVRGRELNKGAYGGVVTADGRYVVYNSYSDVYAKHNQQEPPCSLYKYDLKTRRTRHVEAGGKPVCAFTSDFAASRDGRYLAVVTMDALSRDDATGQDVYWVDTVAKRAVLMSDPGTTGAQNATGENISATIDGSGRLVAFVSGALTPFSLRTDRTVIVRDVRSGKVIDVNTGLAGAAATATEDPRLSDDGRWLTFLDNHGEVPAANTADLRAVYVRDLTKGIDATTRLEPLGGCVKAECTHPASQNAVPSANGKVIAYLTSSGLDDDDADHAFDVYVARR